MSRLHITYKGRTATITFDNESGLLDRYINMDTGQISYTMGKQIGGKSINPNGALGKRLIRIADIWIRNPDTVWDYGTVWLEPLYGKKYERFYYECIYEIKESTKPKMSPSQKVGCLLCLFIFLLMYFLTR